jgi:hypothetical protein
LELFGKLLDGEVLLPPPPPLSLLRGSVFDPSL